MNVENYDFVQCDPLHGCVAAPTIVLVLVLVPVPVLVLVPVIVFVLVLLVVVAVEFSRNGTPPAHLPLKLGTSRLLYWESSSTVISRGPSTSSTWPIAAGSVST